MDELTEAELQAMLNAPETEEERQALDRLVSDPEIILAEARSRLALRSAACRVSH